MAKAKIVRFPKRGSEVLADIEDRSAEYGQRAAALHRRKVNGETFEEGVSYLVRQAKQWQEWGARIRRRQLHLVKEPKEPVDFKAEREKRRRS